MDLEGARGGRWRGFAQWMGPYGGGERPRNFPGTIMDVSGRWYHVLYDDGDHRLVDRKDDLWRRALAFLAEHAAA